MNIDGMNSISGLKVTNSLKNKKQSKANASFKGHILTQDNEGNQVYKFFLPNAPKNTKLQLAVMSKDKDGYYKVLQNSKEFDVPTDNTSVTVDAKKYIKDPNTALGYKFYVDGKEYTDKGVKGDQNYTLTVPMNKANPHRNRLMLHLLVDSFNLKNPSEAAKRNHFNLLGGNIQSVIEKVPELAEIGYGELIAPPIFGQDNKSSHGYWTTNPRQITKNLGSYKDFKDLNIALFKEGMGWTADGAFVNEGQEGIHVMDIFNWGIKSPFVSMFETKDIENNQVRLGILSKNDDVNKHIHIKLVNAPYKITFEKTVDGYKEKSVEKNTVDATRGTYIQLFDDRLVSESQANDDEVFDVYAIKEPADRYSIASSRDSVQPVHFRVQPSEVKANFNKYKENKKIDSNSEFKNFLTQWTNFSIVNSNKDGGASLWVGNNDIMKKRFILSDYSLNAMNLSPEKQKEVEAAQYQVEDDTVQVETFWTNESSRILTEYAAKILSNRVDEEMAKDENLTKQDAYAKVLNETINEKLLPKGALAITEKEKLGENKFAPSALENILETNEFTGNRSYKLRQTVMPQNITDGIMAYPLEAIEVSPDLTTVFAYPFIKNAAVDDESVGLTRYEMYKMGDKYYNKMPEQYRETYKLADKIYATTLTDKALQIMKSVNDKTNGNLFNGNELTEEGKEVYSLIAPDVAKFMVVSAIAPELDFNENSDILEYDLNKLRRYDLNKLNLQYETSPEDTAIRLLNKIDKGVKSIPNSKIEKFVNHITNRIQGIDSDSINVAKLIIGQTETGLDWRIDAAKDVGDWDSVEAGRYNSAENEKRIMRFWNKSNTSINKYNPNSYKIGEITDWRIDKSQFIDRSAFDTMTDYEAFFSGLISMYAQNDEGKFSDNFAEQFYNSLNSYFDNGTPDNLNFAHRFVGNHDKPRILHMLATNVNSFNQDKAQEVQRVLEKGFNSSNEFNSLDNSYKEAIKTGLSELRNGHYHVNGEKKEFDSENFAIRPFDYSVEDAINEARIINKDFDKFAKDNPKKIKKLKAETLKAVLEPAMSKYRSILFAMVGLPGTPTHYAGDEFGQTGWETFCKNEKQENRNAVRWDLLKDDNYDFVKTFYERDFKPLMKVRSMDGASALVNGTTQPMHGQKFNNIKDEESRGGAVAMYRYNDKTDAIVVLHGAGYGRNPEQNGWNGNLDYINLGGLISPLKEGTVYVDALNTSSKYKVAKFKIKINEKDEKEILGIKKLDKDGNPTQEVPLGNAGLILLRESGFDGKKFSFKGRIENANVKLANTKYNFNYMNK